MLPHVDFETRVSVGCRCILQTNCPVVFRDRPFSLNLTTGALGFVTLGFYCAQLSLGSQTQVLTLDGKQFTH